MTQSFGLPAPVDYTDLDFASLFKRLQELVRSVRPDLDTETATELARLMLEGKAYVGDVLAYYLRNAAREARIVTATQRKSLFALVKLIGYRPRGATASRVTETFTLAAAPAAAVTISAGRLVQTPEVATPVKFQLLADLVFAIGQTTATATVENSLPAEDVFDSTGTANQQFLLSQTPYLDGSTTIGAANGAYIEVPNLFRSGPADRHFTTVVDQLDRATVVFGNGLNGAIPVGTITVDYKTGGGADGNVSPGSLTTFVGSLTDAAGATVRVSCTNVLKADLGTDRATVQEIQQLAPESLRVQGRAVSNEDYEIVLRNLPGVGRALHLTADEDVSIPENEGWNFIVPNDLGIPSSDLLTLARAQFEQVVGFPKPPIPKMNAFPLVFVSTPYLVIDVVAGVFFRANVVPKVAAAAVRANLAAFFALRNPDGTLNPMINFGQYMQDVDGNPTGIFALSDLFDVVKSTTGILRVDPSDSAFTLNGLHADVPILQKQFPKLGTVTVLDLRNGVAV